MQSFEDAAKTFREFECELERLDDTYDVAKLDQVEMRAVRILQLLEVQIGGIGAELYSVVKQRRAAILQGKYAPKAEAKVEEPAPAQAPKTTRKKSAKKSKK